jgi:ADP-ribosyl-[dinitrogen reductase] hydrolase
VRTSTSDPIEVAWIIEALPPGGGRVGLTFAPGKKGPSFYGKPWNRDLGADLDRLREFYCAGMLVPLLEDQELEEFKIGALVEEAEARGMVVHRLPVPDLSVPSVDEAVRVVDLVLSFARAGKNAVIHCRGGVGRAGTVGACCLVRLGDSPEGAMKRVRKARGPKAIENDAQESFVVEFADSVGP